MFQRESLLVALAALAVMAAARGQISYPVPGTGQTKCYDNAAEITCPRAGKPFYGQNAQHPGRRPAYRDNGDGTINDLKTGLMWVKARGSKMKWTEAVARAAACRAGGHEDWRMPNIKELYSLIQFTGKAGMSVEDSTPYIDTTYFGFAFGDTAAGVRLIDAQDWSATEYIGDQRRKVFGVNFVDGRIKSYPKKFPDGREGLMYARYVRGNPKYGVNDFVDEHDGTVLDKATGLMWCRDDSGKGMNWEAALAWVQAKNAENYLGHADWRLPDAKELQSIVDYRRAPDLTGSAAIDPVFHATRITNEGGVADYPFYWTSTTHRDEGPGRGGHNAVYVSFGRALGFLEMPPRSGRRQLTDIHGAGAQRSDPKTGDPSAFPQGRGPQGDVIRIFNYVRLVRG